MNVLYFAFILQKFSLGNPVVHHSSVRASARRRALGVGGVGGKLKQTSAALRAEPIVAEGAPKLAQRWHHNASKI